MTREGEGRLSASPRAGIDRSQQIRMPKPNLDAVLPSQGAARFGGMRQEGNVGEKENQARNGSDVDMEDDFEMMLGFEQEDEGLLDDEEMGLLEDPDGDLVPLGLDEDGMEPAEDEEKEGGGVGAEPTVPTGKSPVVPAAVVPVASNRDGGSQQPEGGRSWGAMGNVIPDREELLPQRDALHATDEYVTVRAVDGNVRVYAPVRKESGMDSGALTAALRRSKGNLLATKIDDLLALVERDQFERVLQETMAEKKRAKLEKKRGMDAANVAEAVGGEAKATPDDPTGKGKARQLWVEKYAPVGFLDLLSDELINREVVKWVKAWDRCVFGGAVASGGTRGDGKDTNMSDPYGRPEHKIILLAGPPGLGKTTLAHIVANHCGYKPMEINASDERNGPALVSKIVSAMEMTSVTSDKRPNCIIIDEIDGASGGGEGRSAIQALIKLAQAKVSGKREKDAKEVELPSGGHDAGGKTRPPASQARASQQKAKPLTRPVICICNDLYAPVLRPLRDIAKVFVVKPPRSEKLVDRLQAICKRERLKADKSTLRGLVEKTECDIRSCLNTMQFIAKKQKTMKLSDIMSVGAGQKDISVGVFRLWKELLHLRQGPSIIGKVAETESQRCLRRYNTLSDFGDQELVLGGMYESLPDIIHFDMALTKTSTVLENIQMVDCIQKRVNRFQDFSLLKYLPACTLRVAGVLAGPENPTVRWPRMLQSSRKDMADRTTMIHKWRLGTSPETYASLGKTPAMLDVLPYLPWLAAPALRPVSRHLYSSEERRRLKHVVDTMLSLGVTFSLEEGDDAFPVTTTASNAGAGEQATDKRSTLEFSPPLHGLWQFEHAEFIGTDAHTVPRDMPMPTRQMVLHELDMERIKRQARSQQEKRMGVSSTPAARRETMNSSDSPRSQTPGKPFTGAVPTTLAQRLEENKRNSSGKQRGPARPARKRNWLEQLKDKESSKEATFTCTQGGTTKKSRAEDMAVLYKFHEGYTNAVRKPVKIHDLL